MTRVRFGIFVLAIFTVTGVTTAQDADTPRVKEPPRAKKLQVHIRYRIRANRDERIRQFRALEKNLADLGFVDDRKDAPDRDLDILDPNAERFTGTIASEHVLQILGDPRVEQISFAPVGYQFPADINEGVPVRIVLNSGYIPRVQQLLHAQVFQHLTRLGFREALGYDTRGHTQLKGAIPYKYLDRLVKDIRLEPSGWFLPDTPVDLLPRPLADRNPIRWVEVMPPAQLPPPLVPTEVPETERKLTPDLRAMLADPTKKETPIRVIVLFNLLVDDRVEQLRTLLASEYPSTVKRDAKGNVIKGPDGLPALTEGAALDGVAGNLASIRFDRPVDAQRFSLRESVLLVRLPREASETVQPLPTGLQPADTDVVLKASGVAAMHKLGYTGAGVKVVVIGTDFSEAEKLIGNGLPKNTEILDLTTELNLSILPAPADPNRKDNGTAAALALVVAAPDAQLVLVRVDPGAIFQLFGVLRLARGEPALSPALRSRLIDITNQTNELDRRKEAAVNEYRQAFEDLADDQATKARRERAKAALEAVLAAQEELTRRVQRFNTFKDRVIEVVNGARVIVNTLEWESGYPLDSVSLLSQALERLAVPRPSARLTRPGDPATAPKPPIVWVQAASTAGAAVWGGPFSDFNSDAAMEFAAPDQPLPPINWSADMNFLALQQPDGKSTPDIPAGTKLRFVMQWREALDPNFPSIDRPAFPVVLRIFKQLDPEGAKIPSDEMQEVARSTGGPYPIFLAESFVVFEQILEFTTTEPGRYALIVAKGYEPTALLPGLERKIEVYPRIVVETLSGKPGDGRAVFRSYTTPDAGVGIPGDSTGSITVGVPVPGELYGGGTGLSLRGKPDLFGPDALQTPGPKGRGTGVAAGYLGGMAATLVQAGSSGTNVFKSAMFEPGRMAVVPEKWLKYLRPAPKPKP